MAHVQYIQLQHNQNKGFLNIQAEMFDYNLLILILAWSGMLLSMESFTILIMTVSQYTIYNISKYIEQV